MATLLRPTTHYRSGCGTSGCGTSGWGTSGWGNCVRGSSGWVITAVVGEVIVCKLFLTTT